MAALGPGRSRSIKTGGSFQARRQLRRRPRLFSNIVDRTPVTGAWISCVCLSVLISTSGSPRVTGSPVRLNHRPIDRLAPVFAVTGALISVIMSLTFKAKTAEAAANDVPGGRRADATDGCSIAGRACSCPQGLLSGGRVDGQIERRGEIASSTLLAVFGSRLPGILRALSRTGLIFLGLKSSAPPSDSFAREWHACHGAPPRVSSVSGLRNLNPQSERY